ncbi:MAG: transketolase, partial [Hydrogenophaga sp.]|uniref:transketolase family protein n=1 Tax=Hydrogenophaga sp. TaxID=1904254 RepID=UPI00272F6DBE
NKLIAFWDDNGISIDGHIEHWYTDDTAKRFEAYGWNVVAGVDGHDVVALEAAIQKAKASTDKPTLICCKTVIGKGSPNKEGTHDVHGAALGHDEVEATRKHIGWNHPAFEIPADIYAGWDAKTKGQGLETLWNNKFAEYKKAYPAEAAEFERRTKGDLPANWKAHVAEKLAAFNTKAETVASRKASQHAINALASALPEFLGGSADLTGSNFTNWEGCHPVRNGKPGNYISYGVREFGMAAIMNGMALHGGLLPFGGTFLMFSEYSRNAIRMAALMKQRVIHVFTHDSIGLGEDGPTHQSVEHAASLRLIPNLDVWRPGDTAETAVAWAVALQNANKPTALLLSRQNLPYAPKHDLGDISRGAYVLAEPTEVGLKKKAQAVIIATGSEVQLALKAQELLAREHKIAVRVVSMPSTTTFDRQEASYKADVLPKGLPRIAVEMGSTDGWWKYGVAAVVGLDTYGESAPAPVLFKHFGFTPENVADTVRTVLAK